VLAVPAASGLVRSIEIVVVSAVVLVISSLRETTTVAIKVVQRAMVCLLSKYESARLQASVISRTVRYFRDSKKSDM
jgi:hypothetical protein